MPWILSLSLAVCVVASRGKRRVPVSALEINGFESDALESNESDALESMESDAIESNAEFTIEETNAMNLEATRALGDPKKEWPDYLKAGKCCYWDDRYGSRQFRYFYYIEKDKKGKNVVSTVYWCPGKWSGWKADGYDCRSQGAFNKVGYKENTDWVMCCKKKNRTKVTYRYAGGSPSGCREKGGGSFSTCYNEDCFDYKNVDESKTVCPDTHDKKVNEKATWACPVKRFSDKTPQKPEGWDFDDMQCAGYSKDCAKTYCVKNSIELGGKRRDCSSWCDPSYVNANDESGATLTATYSFLIFSIAAGTLSLTSA